MVVHPLIGIVSYVDQWVAGAPTSTFTYSLATLSGTGTSFTLPSAPNPPNALILVQNGLLLLQGLGYTISGTAIILAVALQTGDSLFALIPSTT